MRERGNSNFTRLLRAQQQFGKAQDQHEPVNPKIIALTGDSVGVVNVPSRTGYIYVRVKGDNNRTTVARIDREVNAGVWVYIQRLRNGVSGASNSYEVVGFAPGSLYAGDILLTNPIGDATTVQEALELLLGQTQPIQVALNGWGMFNWGEGSWG